MPDHVRALAKLLRQSHAIICPAQIGRPESCSTCGLCWATTRRVAFSPTLVTSAVTLAARGDGGFRGYCGHRLGIGSDQRRC
jgi:polyferredoxin